MNAREAITKAIPKLRAAGIDEPATDARRLIAHAMDCPLDRLIVRLDDDLSPDQQDRFDRAIGARMARQPLAQIIGRRDFYGHTFMVTKDTLDPRPETEILVAEALSQPFYRMLDLGTGTGCILLSCLKGMKMAKGLGTDISGAALEVARRNASALSLAGRAQFMVSDWFSAVSGRYDLITSNPPYIAWHEMAGLSPEIREWEPQAALVAGDDGLDAYRIIARGAGSRLLPGGGRLLLEIGPDQADAVTALLAKQGLRKIRVLTDLDGRDRVIAALAPAGEGCGSA